MIQRSRVFDCFCFFNELDLLKLRIETLRSIVDVFVVVEGTKTFTGRDKPLHFCHEDFGDCAEKIRHVVVDSYPFDFSDPWRVERYQRNSIARGLTDAEAEDLILVGDVDEIPNPQSILAYRPHRYKRGDFEQRNFAYYINNCHVDECGNPVPWYGTKITTFQYFNRVFRFAEQVRRFKGSGIFRVLQRTWFYRYEVQKIPDGGWHFSWLNGADGILTKLESFSHQEFNTPESRNPQRIASAVSDGKDILKLGASFVPLPIDKSFPGPLIQTPEKYARLFYPAREPSPGSSSV